MPRLSRREYEREVDEGTLFAKQRCVRWGVFERWCVKVRIGPASSPSEVNSWWAKIVLEGNVEQIGIESTRGVCPVNLEEAVETRRCVSLLDPHLRNVVWQEHVRSGRRQRDKAWTLGITTRTFRHRLDVAYPLLAERFKSLS